MPARRGLLAPQNTFLDTIATRFDGTHSNFVLGNAKIAKVYPIVYCSDGFCELTCYSRAQIMQKSCACNFLYGQKTDQQHREAVSRALETKQELKLEVILYKSSGTPFWCLLDIVPIQDEKHEVVLFLCSHKDITKHKLQEQQRHQLAQLHAQKQQQLHDQLYLSQQQQQQQQQHSHDNQQDDTGSQTETGKPLANELHQQQQAQEQPQHQQLQLHLDAAHQNAKLNAADEAELAAIANQNALISMDEFGILDDSGAENDFDEGDDSEDHDKQTASQYSRRRSRAVLYQLSGHYGDRRNVNMKSKLKLNNRMNIPEYKTTTIEKQRFILSHYGLGKSCWDWLILAVTFYVAIVVPYNATFGDKLNETGDCKIDSFDIGVEVVFVIGGRPATSGKFSTILTFALYFGPILYARFHIDVILNFRTTFVNRKGEVVTRPKTICKHYVRGWFVVDALAALPFDFLCGLNIYSRSRLDLNLLKLIRLLRLARLLQKMDRYSQYSYIILTLLMLMFSLLAHWCACIWYAIAMKEIEGNPPGWKIGWIHQLSDKLGYSVVNTTDMASSYVTALYFTTSSLTSVGFGNVSANTNAEKIFSIVIMLIGALMHALVFGNVTALIRVMYARRSNYQTRLRDLKDFFRLHQLPKELQQRMSDYFQTTWSLNHGIETFEILKDFPEELRGDVSLHLHREVLSLPIFETAPQGFLKSLAQHIESKFCCPTEYLIHRGDALNYLYLVCNGSMEVLQDNMVVAILGKGDLVGYDVNAIATPEHTQYGLSKTTTTMLVGGSLGNQLVKSSSDLKALTYCDLKCIHISGLLEVLKLYPEFSDTFHREIIHDLTFNLRETHEEQLADDEDDDENHAEEPEQSRDNHDDNSGDDDDDEDHEGAAAPNMGHLFRSITSAGENQIGRYDHDFGAMDSEQAGEDENENEDEEEEEEDDEEEDQDDNNADGSDETDDDNEDRRGGGGAGATGARRTGLRSPPPQPPPDGDPPETASSNGAGSVSGGRLISAPDCVPQARQLAPAKWAPAGRADHENLCDHHDDGSDNNNNNNNCSNEASSSAEPSDRPLGRRRRVQRASGSLRGQVRGGLADRSSRSGRSSQQTARSYDVLIDCGRRLASQSGSAAQPASLSLVQPRSDELVLLANSPRPGDLGAAAQRRVGRLRPAIGGSIRRQATFELATTSGRAAGARKPPLSFDLSRNTTAIVDRRRRSAGCIPRPLLLGAVSLARRRQAEDCSSSCSLTHIHEDQAMLVAGRKSPPSGRPSRQSERSPLALPPDRHTKRASNLRLSSSSVAPEHHRGPASASSASASASASQTQLDQPAARLAADKDLRSIDARISGISASVHEMKQEIKAEMNQVRAAVQLMTQLLDKQALANLVVANSPDFLHSTTSLVSSSSASASTTTTRRAPANLAGMSATVAGTTANTSQMKANSSASELDRASPSKLALLRSQSTTSLPANTQLARNKPNYLTGQVNPGEPIYTLQSANNRHTSTTTTGRSIETSFAEHQPASGGALLANIQEVPNVSKQSATQHLPARYATSTLPLEPLSQNRPPESAANSQLNVWPNSQCSSSQSPLSARQSNSGQSNLASDNDSGRSSSSMNSSYLNKFNGSAANQRQVLALDSSAVSIPPSYPQPAQLNSRSGRLAKMLVTTDTGGDQSAQRYTIDIEDHQIVPNVQNSSGGSIV